LPKLRILTEGVYESTLLSELFLLFEFVVSFNM
jgi:hypothetical protein